MLKPLLLLPVILAFGYHPAPVPAPTPQANSSAPAASAGKTAGKAGPEVSARVKKIYEVDCALCHGATGNGKTDLATDMKLTMQDFTDPRTLSSKSDQEIFDLIRKGKGQMPPEEEGRAKNEEVKSLIIYLRSLSKDQPVPAAVPARETPAPPPPPPPPPPPAQAPSKN